MVDQFYGTTTVCTGFNLCLLCSQRLPVSERGSWYPHQFFSWISKHNLKSTTKIYKESHACLNLKGLFTTNINKVGNVCYLRFSSNILWSSVRSSNCKHSSGNSVTTQACTADDRSCVVLRSRSSLQLPMLCTDSDVSLALFTFCWWHGNWLQSALRFRKCYFTR